MKRQSRFASAAAVGIVLLLSHEFPTFSEIAHANGQTLIVNEDFSDADGLDSWVFSGSGTAIAGGSWSPIITSTDPALLLTESTGSQAGFALYNVAQTTEAGFDISFKMSHWGGSGLTGGTGADGVSFFVKDGSDSSVTPGVNGSRLGYGPNTTSNLAGLSGALLGVGLDRRNGSATYTTTAGSFTCPSLSHPSYSNNLISLRGPGQGVQGYCPLAIAEQIARPWDTAVDGTTVLTSRGDGRSVRVKYDTSVDPARVKVWVDAVADNDSTDFDVVAPAELVQANSYKFGFTASTGGSHNNHSIWDVVVSTVTPLPDLSIDSETLPTATQGEAYETRVVASGGANPLSFSVSAGTLPNGMSLSSSGVLSGTPTEAGTFNFTVSVTDGQPTPATESKAFSLGVSSPIIETSQGHDFFVTFDANLLGYDDRVRTNVSAGIPLFAEQWLYLSGDPGTVVNVHYPPIDSETGIGTHVEEITIGNTGVYALNASERLVSKTLGATEKISGTTPYKDLLAVTESFVNGLPPTVSSVTELDAAGASASDSKAFNSLRIQVASVNKTITTYGAHLQRNTSDAFSAIPTHSLGTRYRAVAWDHFVLSNVERPSRISVIATQPGTTTITITPPSGHSGLHDSSENSPPPRTGQYSVSLSRGEVYSVTSDTAGSGLQDDVTGTLIESDKAVVVSSGNECAKVGDLGSCDHLVQYLPTTTAWGTGYVLASSINAERTDRYRIVADTDGTTLELNGSPVSVAGQPVVLDAGEFHEIEASSVGAFDVLETNHPVLAAKFIAGAQGGELTTDFWDYTGDPSLTILTPTLQFLDTYRVATPASGFEKHSINVVVPTANLGSLTITNVDSTSGVTRSVANPGNRGSSGTITGTDYSFVRFDVPAGAYEVSADEGIGVYVEGFKNFDSYSYGGGTAFVNLVENPEGALAVERELERQSLTPGTATTTIAPISNTALTAGTVQTNASNTENFTLAFSSSDTSVCTIDSASGLITLVNLGTCRITASHAETRVGDTLFGASSASLSFSVVAAPSPTSTQERRNRDTPPAVAPQLPAPRPNPFAVPGRTTPAPTPAAVSGPVVRGQQLTPPANPLATVNGVPTPTQTEAIGDTGVRVRTGGVNLDVAVQSANQGRITQNPSGVPELSVVKNQSTLLTGGGVLPGSTVQVFMAFGEQAAELARIPVGPTGTFSGEAAFRTPGSNAPLPIGRHVLQVVSVDRDGNQTVVDMPINVAQPSPQPEILLANGEPPALTPGQSLATSGGEPVDVTVIPVPDNKQTVIDGGDWTMSIVAQGDGSNVTETTDGQVVIEFIRDQAAEVSGSGFMPFTRADVWLFSEPTLLGTVDIDENGEFNGTVNIDGRVVAVGEHTLQLQGVGEDGYVRSANLGVVVNDVDIAAPTAEQISLTWWWWVIAAMVLTLVSLLWWGNRRKSRS